MLGIVAGNADDDGATEQVAVHLPALGRVETLTHRDELGLLIVRHDPDGEPGAIVTASAVATFAYWGWPRYRGHSLTQPVAERFASNLAAGGLHCLDDLAGHFQLAIHDMKGGRVVLVNDKMSTHPWYYHRGTRCIGAPNPLMFRALKGFGDDLAIDERSIAEFIASGHLRSDHTFYGEVGRLRPGGHLLLNGVGREPELGTHWTPAYRPNLHEDRLQALETAIADCVAASPEHGAITLSGGLDSRALVGESLRHQRKVTAVTYSFGIPMLPDGDEDVARRVAARAGIDWEMHETAPADLVTNFEAVLLATGGETDTSVVQDGYLGRAFYTDIADRLGPLIRADEAWGWGDAATTAEDAFKNTYLFNLSELSIPNDVIEPDAYARLDSHLQQWRAAVIDQQPSADTFDDFKDRLYITERSARFIQNMAAYRRQFIPHHAPFLDDNVLDAVTSLSSDERVRKAGFRAVCRRRYPNLFSIEQEVTVRRMGYYLENTLQKSAEARELVADALIHAPAGSLGGVLNTEGVRRMLGAAASGDGRASYYWKHQINQTLRKVPWVRRRLLSAVGGRVKFPVVMSGFVFRMAVLSRALREYESTP